MSGAAREHRNGFVRISTETEINENVKPQRLSVAGKDIRRTMSGDIAGRLLCKLGRRRGHFPAAAIDKLGAGTRRKADTNNG